MNASEDKIFVRIGKNLIDIYYFWDYRIRAYSH